MSEQHHSPATLACPGSSSVPTLFTGISRVGDGEIFARGIPIEGLVGELTFVEMLYFQLQARMPEAHESQMLEAYLVSLCEHGVTSPSTHGARVASSVRAPFGASAMGFIAGAMGEFHFGALERAMRDLQQLNELGISAEEFVEHRLEEGQRIWGYGHRFHRSEPGPPPSATVQEDRDPRVRALLALADELEWRGEHLRRVREIGRALHERKGVPINIDGVAAGLLLDMGFRPEIALLFVVLGRLPNIARLHQEEQSETPNRFTGLATRNDPTFDRVVDREIEQSMGGVQ